MFCEFIARYDRPEALFYLDPQYFGTEDFYGPGAFERADFGCLAEQLAGIAGQFILTVNDTPETRAIFWNRVLVTYMAAEGGAKSASELMVSRVAGRIASRRCYSIERNLHTPRSNRMALKKFRRPPPARRKRTNGKLTSDRFE